MKILYFYQYFTTPKGSYGTRVYEFTKEWVKQGHEVTVVTAVYAKSDIRANRFIENREIDGINLKIINILIDNKQPVWKRIYTFVMYSLLSLYFALTQKADVVIASSGPITIGLPGLAAKIFRRKKFVFEVRDLWPEAPVELGVIKNKLIQKLSYAFEGLCYNKSDLIVALSPGMKRNIEERFPHVKVISVPNSANFRLFAQEPDIQKVPEIIRGKKYAVYTGNIGPVNNSMLLYRTAKALARKGREDIHIVLIGEGQQKEELQRKANGMKNFHVLNPMPKKDLIHVIKTSMASLVPLKDLPVLNTSSPNKLFESMAAGVPVIQTTTGWIKRMLEESGAGFTVSASDENEMAEKLILLADNESLRREMGEKGFLYAKTRFDKEVLARKMLKAIEEAARN